MHSILKDGSYIQYGPKIIPNPNAEGGGGGGEGIETVKVTVKFVPVGETSILDNITNFSFGEFLTDKKNDGEYHWFYNFSGVSDPVLNCPIINNDLVVEIMSDFLAASDTLENYWILDSGDPVRSVSGDCEKIATSEIKIFGDCTITINVFQD